MVMEETSESDDLLQRQEDSNDGSGDDLEFHETVCVKQICYSNLPVDQRLIQLYSLRKNELKQHAHVKEENMSQLKRAVSRYLNARKVEAADYQGQLVVNDLKRETPSMLTSFEETANDQNAPTDELDFGVEQIKMANLMATRRKAEITEDNTPG